MAIPAALRLRWWCLISFKGENETAAYGSTRFRNPMARCLDEVLGLGRRRPCDEGAREAAPAATESPGPDP